MSASPRRRMVLAGAATVGIFLLIQLAALALVEPFVSAGFQAVEDPSDPTNTLAYFLAILVATGVILLILRLDIGWLLRAIVAVMSGMLSLYVLVVLVPRVVEIGGFNALAWGLAAAIAVALYVYPEWYVIDSAGVRMGAGGAGLFGISFGPLPAVLLLSVLAVYDAISVYRTEHMLTLAAGVTDLKLPLVLVIPVTWGYSFIADTPAVDMEEDLSDDGDGSEPTAPTE
ncbi:MAG: presenilin family intramembrane aspartyl protease PSH, partial [Halobacteriales archaeon]|nr:presenilin family intramembrane aspartyl protease PSH [Halobacteriales archaeon]